MLATHSKYGICILALASYCERINSMGALTMVKNCTALDDDLLAAIIVLRMNRDLLNFLLKKYASLDAETLMKSVQASSLSEMQQIFAAMIRPNV